jgi:hypothetical protein
LEIIKVPFWVLGTNYPAIGTQIRRGRPKVSWFPAVSFYMEPINNVPPQITPNDTATIAARALAAAEQETAKLMELGQTAPPPPVGVGQKVDVKV